MADDVWVTIQMRVFGLDKNRASRIAQGIIGGMYQPYGSNHGYDHAQTWVTDEPLELKDPKLKTAPPYAAELLTPMLQRWAESASVIGPPCAYCGHRKVMHDLGVLHVDDRALTSIVDCLECFIDATRDPSTRGTAGKCGGYRP